MPGWPCPLKEVLEANAPPPAPAWNSHPPHSASRRTHSTSRAGQQLSPTSGQYTVTYRTLTNSYYFAPTLFRLDELYEGAHDTKRAGEYYGRFVECWKNGPLSFSRTSLRQVVPTRAGVGSGTASS